MNTFQTFAEMQASTQNSTRAKSFICTERANAEYILQPSGYVALPGDVTFANGRVAALQISDVAKSGWFSSLQDAVDRHYKVSASKDYNLTAPISFNATNRDVHISGEGRKITSSSGAFSIFGSLTNEQSVISVSSNTVTIADGSQLALYIESNIQYKPVIKIVSDDLIDGVTAGEYQGELVRAVSISSGVITLDRELLFTYLTSPRLASLESGKVTIEDFVIDIDADTDRGTRVFLQNLNAPIVNNLEVLRGNDAGVLVRSCFNSIISSPKIRNLTDDAGGGFFGYGVNDSNSCNTKVINGEFSNTRHAYTTNTNNTVAGGDMTDFGVTSYSKVIDSNCTNNSGDAFDTHSNCYNVEFINITGSNNKNGLIKDRGNNTKVINPVSELDAFGVRSSESSDGLKIINPVIINSTFPPLFFENTTRGDVYVEGGVLSKIVGNEVIRATNVNLSGSTNIVFSGGTDFSGMIKKENSSLNLSALSLDIRDCTANNIRVIQIQGGTGESCIIESLNINDLNNATTNIELLSNLSGNTDNEVILRTVNSNQMLAFPSTGLPRTSRYTNNYYAGSTAAIFKEITANNQGLPELNYNGEKAINLITTLQNGNKDLKALEDGAFNGQQITISLQLSSTNLLTVKNGPTYNTSLSGAIDKQLLQGESLKLVWTGSIWEESQ